MTDVPQTHAKHDNHESMRRLNGIVGAPFWWAQRVMMMTLRRVLPYSDNSDRIFAYFHFLVRQGRIPRRRMLFHDYLFRLKMSGELLSLPRQLVSDKELCKIYVDHRIGPGRTIPTLAVLRKNDVAEYAFPERCVIKPTHMSGRIIIRKTGEDLDLAKIRSWFDESLYQWDREQNYKYLEPKVIVEPIVFDGVMFEMKIHCYRGRARIFSVHPMENDTLERYDRDWNRLPVKQNKPFPKVPTPRPESLDQILAVADRLSSEFEYMRVDMYACGKDWIVGELTNCHQNINRRFVDLQQEKIFSSTLFGDEAG